MKFISIFVEIDAKKTIISLNINQIFFITGHPTETSMCYVYFLNGEKIRVFESRKSLLRKIEMELGE